MPALNSIFETDFFLPGVEANGRRQVLDIVAKEISAHLGRPYEEIFHALLQQEQQCPSGVGEGIAVMHLQIKNLFKPQGMILTLQKPVNFFAPDSQPVDVFCLILSPAHDGTMYLPMVSRVTRALKTPAIHEGLLSARDKFAVRALFDDTDSIMQAA